MPTITLTSDIRATAPRCFHLARSVDFHVGWTQPASRIAELLPHRWHPANTH